MQKLTICRFTELRDNKAQDAVDFHLSNHDVLAATW